MSSGVLIPHASYENARQALARLFARRLVGPARPGLANGSRNGYLTYLSEDSEMRVDMAQVGRGPVLAGAIEGRNAAGRLIGELSAEPSSPEPLFLDFMKIEVATASYLRESVLTFRDLVRARRSTLYPVIANANEAVRDELAELMRARGDALVACTLKQNGQVTESGLIGDLDSALKTTFDLVRQLGETGAGELMRAHGESEGLKHTTAWNNRLAALAGRGLLVEISRGRAKRYRPVFEGA